MTGMDRLRLLLRIERCYPSRAPGWLLALDDAEQRIFVDDYFRTWSP